MYIWKTSKLSEELKDNKVPDSDWIKYALIFLIFYTVTPYLMFLAPYVSNEVMITEAMGILVVSILGVVVTYRTNNRDGKTYILRSIALSIALSIPLSFRFVALSVLVGMAIVSFDFGAQHYFIVELLSTLSVIALQALYFWRLNVHLKYINS
ncbi:membrane protein [Vibrio harveyi]|nr:membrane protein [Vibrio harveyi]